MRRKAEWRPSLRLPVLALGGLLAVSIAVALYLLPTGSATAARHRTANEQQWIRQTIAGMTLPEKVGQRFEVNGYGSSVRDSIPG